MINKNNLPIAKLQDQDLQLITVDQIVELGDNELNNVTGGILGLGYGIGYSERHKLSFGDSLKFIGFSVSVGNLFAPPVGSALSTPKE
jgi:hypothetical protein